MKIGLLSDIHGNLEALKAVIEAAKKYEIKNFLITGDFVGYYYDIKEILKILDKIKWVGVRGNHERMFLNCFKSNKIADQYKEKYGSSFYNIKSIKNNDALKNILRLPDKRNIIIKNKKILICHGSPWNKDMYLYNNTNYKNIERIFNYNQDLIMIGHTHRQSLWKNKKQICINPGSVGQARDYKSKACWAIWNISENKILFKRTKYDTSSVLKQCKKYDPKLKYLNEVIKKK